MSGLNSILSKPRSVSRSAKQRFLERDARRRAEAERLFEARAEEKAAALVEAHVVRTMSPEQPVVAQTADDVLESVAAEPARAVKPAVHTQAVRGITAEVLLGELSD